MKKICEPIYAVILAVLCILSVNVCRLQVRP